MLDSDGKPCNYINYYSCDHKGSLKEGQRKSYWTDAWSCMCNDRCPVCNHEVSPFESIDIGDENEK